MWACGTSARKAGRAARPYETFKFHLQHSHTIWLNIKIMNNIFRICTLLLAAFVLHGCDGCNGFYMHGECIDTRVPPRPGDEDCRISGGVRCLSESFPPCECPTCEDPITVVYDLQGGYGHLETFKCPSIENKWLNDTWGCALYHRDGTDIWKPGYYLAGWFDRGNAPRRNGPWFIKPCAGPGAMTTRVAMANWAKCEVGTYSNQSTGSRCKPCKSDPTIGPGATSCP